MFGFKISFMITIWARYNIPTIRLALASVEVPKYQDFALALTACSGEIPLSGLVFDA